VQLVDLIFHKRDQRRTDYRRTGAQERGKLKAQRFARASRQHRDHIAPGQHGAEGGLLLAGAEGGVPVERCDCFQDTRTPCVVVVFRQRVGDRQPRD